MAPGPFGSLDNLDPPDTDSEKVFIPPDIKYWANIGKTNTTILDAGTSLFTVPIPKIIIAKNARAWISYKINIRHPLQLKKSKSWKPFRSYQLNSTANPAHLPQNWAKLAKSAVLFIAGSSKTAPMILIFSIAMGAHYSFYVKSIATFALAFFGYIISVLASVALD